ncbi:MAG: hypothetical protein IPM91_17640 [Bacteroidetes bacterium]|nr:hypothetical protein [Bacteroidota bacterium]
MKNPKSILLVCLMLLISMTELFGCDMCGCFMGILPSDRRSFVGSYYRYRSFSGTAVSGSAVFPDGHLRLAHTDHNGAPIPTDGYEIYRALELRGRYYLHPRLEMNFVLPYMMNSGSESGQNFSVNGIGDLSLLAGWQLIDEASTGKFRHRLLVGGGVKLATGNESQKQDEIRHSLLVQCGTGTNDFLFYSTYQLAFKNLGLNLTPLYKINGKNKFNERIDNSKTISGSIFYRLNAAEKLQFLPLLQSYYEFTKVFMSGEALQENTRMNVLMCGPGLDVYWKNVGFSLSALYACYEEENNSGLNSRLRLMFGVNVYFDQSRFVF